MFDYFCEGSFAVYLLFGTIATIVGILWYYQQRNRKLQAALVVAFGFLGVLSPLDFCVVTERERLQADLQKLAKSAVGTSPDFTTMFKHLDDGPDTNFSGMSGKNFRELAKQGLSRRHLHDLIVWDVEVKSLDKVQGKATIVFRSKVKMAGTQVDPFYRCEANMIRMEGVWKMQTLKVFKPETTDEVPVGQYVGGL